MSSHDRDDELDRVIAAYLKAVDEGNSPDPEKVLEEHPHLASRLREFFAAQGRVADAVGSLDAPELRPGVQLGDFLLEERIGEGGMGIVYQARQVSLKRRVAVKVLPPPLGMTTSSRVRFHREAQAAAKLQHTSIVAIHAEGEQDGVCFYAMEHVAGLSLDRVIAELRGDADDASEVELTTSLRLAAASSAARRGTSAGESRPGSSGGELPSSRFDDIARWIAEAAEALEYAHEMGVIHRDVKPSNLMVGADGRVKLMDFGLARMLEEPGMTLTGECLGTPRYMSPEQIAAGRIKLDHRTDVYSLGATLYELLTLRPPFDGRSRDEIIAKIIAGDLRRPRDLDRNVPLDLETICLKALERDVARRYESAGQLAADVRRYLRRDPIRARRPSAVRRLLSLARRHRIAVALIGGGSAAALVAAALAWLLWPASPLTLTAARQLTRDAGLTRQPTLSADGRWLSYASDRGRGEDLDIWLQELKGGVPRGEPRPLTSHHSEDHEPALSPDGTQVVFRSERDGGGIYLIATSPNRSPEDAGTTRLAPRGRRPRFSPDGSLVAYWVGQPGGSPRGSAYVVPARGGSSTPLQPGFAYATHPVWSPNGRGVLFFGSRSREGASPSDESSEDWWVTPLDGGPAVKTGAFEVLGDAGIPGKPAPAMWSDQRDEVFFWAAAGDSANLWTESISDRTTLWAAPVSTASWRVAGTPRRVLGTSGGEQDLWVGRDSTVVYANLVFNSDVWSLGIDPETGLPPADARLVRLTDHPAYDGEPFVTDDESAVAFISGRSGHRNVWLHKLSTGRETQVTDDSLFKWFPLISPDGTRVAYAAGRPGEPSSIHVRDLEPPGAERVYPECGGPRFWTRDGERLLYNIWDTVRFRNDGIGSLEVATGRKTVLLTHPEYDLWQPQLSPEGGWIAFQVTTADRSWVCVAPYRSDRRTPEEEWVEVTAGVPWEDHARWSADGGLLYFVSEQDGYRCVWARRLDRTTHRPIGEPFEVYPSHSARRSMLNLGVGALELSASNRRIVFNLGELTGNVSIATLSDR